MMAPPGAPTMPAWRDGWVNIRCVAGADQLLLRTHVGYMPLTISGSSTPTAERMTITTGDVRPVPNSRASVSYPRRLCASSPRIRTPRELRDVRHHAGALDSGRQVANCFLEPRIIDRVALAREDQLFLEWAAVRELAGDQIRRALGVAGVPVDECSLEHLVEPRSGDAAESEHDDPGDQDGPVRSHDRSAETAEEITHDGGRCPSARQRGWFGTPGKTLSGTTLVSRSMTLVSNWGANTEA